MQTSRIMVMAVIAVVGCWCSFGWIGLAFWLGDHFFGGNRSRLWWPAIIYFGMAPLVIVIIAATVWIELWLAGIT